MLFYTHTANVVCNCAVKGTIFGKRFYMKYCCLAFCTAAIWKKIIQEELRAVLSYICPILIKIGISWQILEKSPSLYF